MYKCHCKHSQDSYFSFVAVTPFLRFLMLVVIIDFFVKADAVIVFMLISVFKLEDSTFE